MQVNITWSMINYYFVCKRKLWLFHNNLTSEHTSEKVKIWKHYHELRYDEEDENVEVELDGIKIDKLTKDYVEEFKKANTEYKWVEMQVLYYIWKLKEKWIIKKWIIKYKENRNSVKIELTPEKEKELMEVIKELENTLHLKNIPEKLKNTKWWPHKKCKWCSYYEFCWI